MYIYSDFSKENLHFTLDKYIAGCYPFENKTKVSALYSIMICIVPYIYIFYLPIFIFKKAKENPIK